MSRGTEAVLNSPPENDFRGLEDWPVSGEVLAVKPEEFKETVIEHFASSASNLAGNRLPAGHEVSTTVDNEHFSVIKDHKKEIEIATGAIIAGLAVGGILAATHHLRLKRKK